MPPCKSQLAIRTVTPHILECRIIYRAYSRGVECLRKHGYLYRDEQVRIIPSAAVLVLMLQALRRAISRTGISR